MLMAIGLGGGSATALPSFTWQTAHADMTISDSGHEVAWTSNFVVNYRAAQGAALANQRTLLVFYPVNTVDVSTMVVGLSNASYPLINNDMGSDATSIGVRSTGLIRFNGGTSATTAAWGVASPIYVAVDINLRLAWFNPGGHNAWNASATANPTENTGGIDISALTGDLYPTFMVNALNTPMRSVPPYLSGPAVALPGFTLLKV